MSDDRLRYLVESVRWARRFLDSDMFIEPDRLKVAARLTRALRPFDDIVPDHKGDWLAWKKRQEAQQQTVPQEE